MKLDCVFSGGRQQIDATEPAEATQECGDPVCESASWWTKDSLTLGLKQNLPVD